VATLLDILFNGGFALVEFVAALVPDSRSETFGCLVVEAVVLRGVEIEFLGGSSRESLRRSTKARKMSRSAQMRCPRGQWGIIPGSSERSG
jgi:hypothetical protein